MRWFLYISLIYLPLSIEGKDYQSPLGLPIEIIDLYIPGDRVEAIPRVSNESSLVIRIAEVKPAKDGFRYLMSVYGLDPGAYNIIDFLQYADSKERIEADPVPLRITTIHPLENIPKPGALLPQPPPKLGGYRSLMIVLSILWLIILGFLIFYRKKVPLAESEVVHEPTLKEKLETLITLASKGELDDSERARLERLIIGHWKRELPEISSLPPARALEKLRQHDRASPLILTLEQWLHSPHPKIDQREIALLLIPFGSTDSRESSPRS